MLKKLGLGFIVLIVVLVAIAYLLPRQVHVERETTIDAPASAVFALVNGYQRFDEWSPWAELDPNATTTIEGPRYGVGAKMSWTGEKVGSGTQSVVESRPNEFVKLALDFGAEGGGESTFRLAPEGSATRLTWSFDTDLGMSPVARYFGLMFDGMIGKDYEKGLAKLKALAEGMSKVDFAGLEVERLNVEPVTVAYVEATSTTDEAAIGAAIGAAYGEVGAFMAKHELSQAGAPITINTRWDESGYVFDAAIPVDRAPDTVAPESRVRIKPTYGGPVLRVVHRGAYRGMPATYEQLFAFAAAYEFETAGPPWDEYVSDPGSTPEDELITNVYLPVTE